MQRVLMQFYKQENYFTVRKALIEAGRIDLIEGREGLIPANGPMEAVEARRRQANQSIKGDDDDYYHTVANPASGEKEERRTKKGYRPGGKTQKRRNKDTNS